MLLSSNNTINIRSSILGISEAPVVFASPFLSFLILYNSHFSIQHPFRNRISSMRAIVCRILPRNSPTVFDYTCLWQLHFLPSIEQRLLHSWIPDLIRIVDRLIYLFVVYGEKDGFKRAVVFAIFRMICTYMSSCALFTLSFSSDSIKPVIFSTISIGYNWKSFSPFSLEIN